MDKKTQQEMERLRRIMDNWDKPLSPPHPVPKPSSTKKKRGRPAKEEEE